MTRQLEATSGAAKEVTERTQLLGKITHEWTSLRSSVVYNGTTKSRRIKIFGIPVNGSALMPLDQRPAHFTHQRLAMMKIKVSPHARMKQRRRQTCDLDGENSDLTCSHMASHHYVEKARAKVEHRILKFEMQQSERRIIIEERRLELEK